MNQVCPRYSGTSNLSREHLTSTDKRSHDGIVIVKDRQIGPRARFDYAVAFEAERPGRIHSD
jgi:hypothetical protein